MPISSQAKEHQKRLDLYSLYNTVTFALEIIKIKDIKWHRKDIWIEEKLARNIYSSQKISRSKSPVATDNYSCLTIRIGTPCAFGGRKPVKIITKAKSKTEHEI